MLNFQHLGLLCCWEIPWPVLTKGSFQSLGPQPSALARPLTPDPLRLLRVRWSSVARGAVVMDMALNR